jgi:hypothetical protein
MGNKEFIGVHRQYCPVLIYGLGSNGQKYWGVMEFFGCSDNSDDDGLFLLGIGIFNLPSQVRVQVT